MKRTSNFYYITLSLIVIIGCFYYSYKNLIPKYRQDKVELALVQAEVNAIDSKMSSLDSSKQTLSDLGDIVDKILVAVPTDKDTPNLITELEAIANKHKTYIPNIQISDSESTDEANVEDNKIIVSFSVNGSFSDLHQFIESLEKDLRFMNIKNINISSSGDQSSLSIQLETYKRTDTSLSGLDTNPNSENNSLGATE